MMKAVIFDSIIRDPMKWRALYFPLPNHRLFFLLRSKSLVSLMAKKLQKNSTIDQTAKGLDESVLYHLKKGKEINATSL